ARAPGTCRAGCAHGVSRSAGIERVGAAAVRVARLRRGRAPGALLPAPGRGRGGSAGCHSCRGGVCKTRSEEHTSELQSRVDLVCGLLLEKKNLTKRTYSVQPG